jgi:hypothetical protein
MWYFGPILAGALADVRAGTPTGRDYTPFSSMQAGGNDVIFVENMVPAAAIPPMQAKRSAIKSGSFTVPLDPKEPT